MTGKTLMEELVGGLDGVRPIFKIKSFLKDGYSLADAVHLSRCSPDNIRTIAEYVRQLEAERDELRRAVEWRDISTAPTNEEILLGWHDADGDWITEIGEAAWGWRNEVANNVSHHGLATNWMPLPPAPSALNASNREGGE